MDRIIQSPGKYIQGADVITRLGNYLKPLAEHWLVVGDKFVLGFAQGVWRRVFTKRNRPSARRGRKSAMWRSTWYWRW